MCLFAKDGERFSGKLGEVDCNVCGGLHQLALIIVLFIKIIGKNLPPSMDYGYITIKLICKWIVLTHPKSSYRDNTSMMVI